MKLVVWDSHTSRAGERCRIPGADVLYPDSVRKLEGTADEFRELERKLRWKKKRIDWMTAYTIRQALGIQFRGKGKSIGAAWRQKQEGKAGKQGLAARLGQIRQHVRNK